MPFAKTILKIGDHHSPDGKVSVTPERLRGWARTFAKMQKAGLKVPVGWDHSDSAERGPVLLTSAAYKRRRSAKDNAGWLEDFKVSKSGDSAEITIDVPRAEDAERVKANLAEISPVIRDKWLDGKKREWSDCITDCDLVIHPVNHEQSQFVETPHAIACALRMGLDSKVYRMGDDPFPPADDKGDEDAPKDEPPKEDDNPDMPKGDEDADGKKMDAIIAHLAELGAVMPSDTDQSNFQDRILTALMTLLKAKQDADAEEENEDEEMPEIQDTSPAFAAMSLKVEELEKRDLANRKEKQAVRRDAIKLSLDTLLAEGRIAPPDVEKLTKPLGKISLSLDSSEEALLTAAELEVQVRKSLPKGAVWDSETRLRMSQVEDTKKPPGSSLNGDNPTDEEAEELVDEVFRTRKTTKK